MLNSFSYIAFLLSVLVSTLYTFVYATLSLGWAIIQYITNIAILLHCNNCIT